MRRLIILLMILLVSVWLGIKIQQDPGYILIAYRLWTIEMPIWTGILLIIAGFILFYSLLRLLSATGSLGGQLHSWFLRRRKHKARNLTSQGLIELAEGRWADAEQNLLKAAMSSDTPLINYLAAAWAAQERHAYERRDHYLALAYQSTPEAELAISVVQAQLQLNHQQWEHALATLRRLLELSPKHRYVLRLLKELYVQLRDWTHLAELMPLLRKNKAITVAEAEALQRMLYQQTLLNAIQQPDVLREYWQNLPQHLQVDSDFLKIYIPVMMTQQEGRELEPILRTALNKHWDEQLIKWYGLVVGEQPAKQLSVVETWLQQRSEDPALLLTAGRLSLRNQLWGKARHYLEFSLQLAPQAETYLLLGELLTQLNEPQISAQLYHQGLQLMVAVPLPKIFNKPRDYGRCDNYATD